MSSIGFLEAILKRIEKPDLIWVPCFRHRDIPSAKKWSEKLNIKLLFDPLISSWDKEVHGVIVEFDPERNVLAKSSGS